MTDEDMVEVVSLIMCVAALPVFLAVFGVSLLMMSPVLLVAWVRHRLA